MAKIQPRTLKGFRDLMPAQALLRSEIIRKAEDVFRAHGYDPIDTPVLEFAEILKGKGGGDTDKELYEFTDKGGRQVAMRFDLTVPLARFVAQHLGELVLPFRRYHVGPVFRGERPQRGRSREFVQCDADLIGVASAEADAEALIVMSEVYRRLGTDVVLRVNERRVLAGVLEVLGHAGNAASILRVLDKREKQGDDAVREELTKQDVGREAIDILLRACTPRDSNEETLAALEAAVRDSEEGTAGVAHLRQVLGLARAAGVEESAIRIDPSIARGLDYYTGIVMEAQLVALPGIGSVGAGGRYDDLASLYTNQELPGVGFTIGVTRLMDALEILRKEEAPEQGAARKPLVVITNPGPDLIEVAFDLAARIREFAKVPCTVYPVHRSHKKQMKYADRLGAFAVLTVDGPDQVLVKDLISHGSGSPVDMATAISFVEKSLSNHRAAERLPPGE